MQNLGPGQNKGADLVARVVNAASSIADALGSVVLAVPAGLKGNRPEGALSPPKQVSGPSAAAARHPVRCLSPELWRSQARMAELDFH
jgi:hypothetical protein